MSNPSSPMHQHRKYDLTIIKIKSFFVQKKPKIQNKLQCILYQRQCRKKTHLITPLTSFSTNNFNRAEWQTDRHTAHLLLWAGGWSKPPECTANSIVHWVFVYSSVIDLSRMTNDNVYKKKQENHCDVNSGARPRHRY